MKSLLRTKKGNAILDGFLIFIGLIVLIFILVVVNKSTKLINDDFQAEGDFPELAKETMEYNTDTYSKVWDGVFVFLLVGLWITSLILAYNIDVVPVFFILTVILIIVLLVIVAEVSNAANEVISDPDLIDSTADYPMSSFIINHLLIIMLVISFTIAIALFGKSR